MLNYLKDLILGKRKVITRVCIDSPTANVHCLTHNEKFCITVEYELYKRKRWFSKKGRSYITIPEGHTDCVLSIDYEVG